MHRDPASQVVLIISGNDSVARTIGKAAKGKVEIVVREWGAPDRELLRQARPKLIVIDDANSEKSDRLWMLTQIKRFAPDSAIFYLAAEHTPQFERRVRAAGVAYYGSADDRRLYPFVEKLFGQLIETTMSQRL
jgi:DNA-binding NarL/FixJ family response regulator